MMADIVVLYGSKYGSTKRYAGWLAEELGADIADVNKARPGGMKNYRIVILGSAVYAGGFLGLGFLKRNFKLFDNSKLILFTCGLADPLESHNRRQLLARLERQAGPALFSRLECFHLRGEIDYSRLSLIHRAMMAMLVKGLKSKRPEDLSGEDREMLKTYGAKTGFVDRSCLTPIIDYVRKA